MNVLRLKLTTKQSADGAILLAAAAVFLFLLGRVGQQHTHGSAKALRVGDPLELTGTKWATAEKTLVLVLSKDCRYCQESAPFYHELVRGLTDGKIRRSIAIVPKGRGQLEWLRDSLSFSQDIHHADLAAIGFFATPSLAIVDSSGTITDLWVGKLSPPDETSILAAVRGEVYAKSVQPIDTAELRRSHPNVVVIDVRDRGSFARQHVPGSTNIPYDELGARAKQELPPGRTIALDCTVIPAHVCSYSTRVLRDNGFSDVRAIELGKGSESACQKPGSGCSGNASPQQ